MFYKIYRKVRSLGGRLYRRSLKLIPPKKTEADHVVSFILAGGSLDNHTLKKRLSSIEAAIAANPNFDKIGTHRDIGKALFVRSSDLYNGSGLPQHLRRYTYPPMLSIALSSHCNAACFFCRDADYKGRTVEWEDLPKLESAIRQARSIDLTGWGEPFFYPKFEEVVERITALNDSPQLITVTTNGSFLSAKWGKLLRGKINRLVISINAATEASYDEQMRYKNKKFTLAHTVDSLREFQAELTAEDRKRIMFHMVANTDNFRDATAMVELAAEVGVPTVNVGNFICNDEAHLHRTLWNVKEEYNQELTRAAELGAKLGVAVSGRRFFSNETEVAGADKCMAPFEACFVEMPGSTAPCCFMGRSRMGNIYDDGFETVWFGELYTKLRHARDLPACGVCTVFTPFDNPKAHMSGFLLTKDVVHKTPTNITLMTSRKPPKRKAAPTEAPPV